MTKVDALEQQRERAKARQADYLAKTKKEEEKIKDLDRQIILAKHEERSNYLAKHNLTWADVERQIEEGKMRGGKGHVSFNQSDSRQDNDL